MAEELSRDYASFIANSNITAEISPIISTAENIQTRISEIENVFLPTIRHDTEVANENISKIFKFKDKFDALCNNIDNLENLVAKVKSDLVKVQKQVEIAKEEIDIPEKNIEIFLKTINIFAKPRDPRETNWNENGQYEAPKIFKAEDFFKQSDDSNNS